jgi:mono/diheme cytochrome c family protein
MQHRIVRRVSWGIATGLAAAAWIFALTLRSHPIAANDSVQPAAQESRGAAAFGKYCAACHQPHELAGGLTDPAAAAAMVTFLEQHGRAQLSDDLVIIAYLVDVPRQKPPGQLRTK